jgi:hypothetical protein
LLQRLGGEEPIRHLKTRAQLAQLVGGTPAQQRGFHQRRRPVAESGAHRGDIGNPGIVRQREFVDRCKRRGTRFRSQVTDVVRTEAQAGAQDGLTPVIITL